MFPQNPEAGQPRTLYQKVINDILARIQQGAFSFDKPIYTESKLMEEYGISRITARRALTELEGQGVLYRKRGVGSFVSRNIYEQQEHAEQASKIFAFIFPFDVSHSGLSTVFQAANKVLMQAGYAASIYITEDDEMKRGRAFLRQMLQMDIAGIAYYPKTSDIHLSLLNQLMLGGKPVVILDIPSRIRYIPSISSDNYGGALQLMEHLIALGHQHIGYLAGVELDSRLTVSDRFAGYVLAQTRAHIPVRDDYVVTTLAESFRRQPATSEGLPTQMHLVVRTLIAKGVTAFVCEHDQLAFEAALACREMGIAVPQQVSICGFDNSEWAKMLPEHITTMEQDMEQVGARAAELLLQGINAPVGEAKQLVIPTRLIVGGSTGTAPDTQASRGDETP